MPVFRREDLHAATRPDWMEVHDFEFFTLDLAAADEGILRVEHSHPKNRIVVVGGEVAVEHAGGRVTLKRKDWIDVEPGGAKVTSMRTTPMSGTSEIAVIRGDWNETNIVSIFQVRPDKPLEMHYHDHDEYWFIFRGHFTATYNGTEIDLKPGDLVATGMGIEHGAPGASTELCEGVGFSTTLYGEKRKGHLWREDHGDPVPARSGY